MLLVNAGIPEPMEKVIPASAIRPLVNYSTQSGIGIPTLVSIRYRCLGRKNSLPPLGHDIEFSLNGILSV